MSSDVTVTPQWTYTSGYMYLSVPFQTVLFGQYVFHVLTDAFVNKSLLLQTFDM